MSMNEDYYNDLCGICEMCGVNKKCPTKVFNYDEHGQDAIDVLEKCIHIKRVKEIMRDVTHYASIGE